MHGILSVMTYYFHSQTYGNSMYIFGGKNVFITKSEKIQLHYFIFVFCFIVQVILGTFIPMPILPTKMICFDTSFRLGSGQKLNTLESKHSDLFLYENYFAALRNGQSSKSFYDLDLQYHGVHMELQFLTENFTYLLDMMEILGLMICGLFHLL